MKTLLLLAALAILPNDCQMAQESIVRPLGLVTQPNRMGGFAPGALSFANGAAMRSPGLLTKLPSWAAYSAAGSIWAVNPSTPHLLLPLDSKTMCLGVSGGGVWDQRFVDAAASFGNQLNGTTPYFPWTFDSAGSVFATRNRDRILLNSNKGILINDDIAPASNGAALPRMAGLAPLPLSATESTSGTVSALLAGQVCALTIVWRRKFSDNYEIVSPPSPPVAVGALVASNVAVLSQWDATSLGVNRPIAGDVIEIYRTRSQAVSVSLGNVFYLTASITLTAAQIAAKTAGYTDTTPDDRVSSGRELYSNPGQTTPLSFKLAPPLAKALATFKGYTFYGYRTDAAKIDLTVLGGISATLPAGTPSARLNGIGLRVLTGTFVSGSPTVTAISAADIVGIAVGQVLLPGPFAGGLTITAVGATTITMSGNANANTTVAFTTVDALLFPEGTISVIDWSALSNQLPYAVDYSVFASATEPPVATPGTPYGITYSPRQFAIARTRAGGGTFTIKASNPQNYQPKLPATTDTALTVSPTVVKNGLAWSEQGQPEAVPPVNTLTVGSGEIYAMHPTRDALWIFASDGLWRLSGTGGAAGTAAGFDWRVDPVDSTLSLSAPHAACVLRDTVYAYTSRGLVAISDSGIQELSSGVINDLLPGPPFSATASIQVAAHEGEDEIWVLAVSGGVTTIFVYNVLQNAWTNSFGSNDGTVDVILAYARYTQKMMTMPPTGAAPLFTESTLFQPLTFQYQTLYNGNPFTLKRWQDATFVARPGDAGNGIIPLFNNVTRPSSQLVSQYNDSRVTFTIPRNAPAVGNGLNVALTFLGTNNLGIYGVSLRAAVLTDQRKQR